MFRSSQKDGRRYYGEPVRRVKLTQRLHAGRRPEHEGPPPQLAQHTTGRYTPCPPLLRRLTRHISPCPPHRWPRLLLLPKTRRLRTHMGKRLPPRRRRTAHLPPPTRPCRSRPHRPRRLRPRFPRPPALSPLRRPMQNTEEHERAMHIFVNRLQR